MGTRAGLARPGRSLDAQDGTVHPGGNADSYVRGTFPAFTKGSPFGSGGFRSRKFSSNG